MRRNERGHLEAYFDLWIRARHLAKTLPVHPLDLHFALSGLRDEGVEVSDGQVEAAVAGLLEVAVPLDGATIRRALQGA